MIRTLLVLAGSSWAPVAALAHTGAEGPHPHPHEEPPPPPPPPAYGTAAIGVLVGSDTSFYGGPASFRFTITGEYDATGNDQFALSIAMPLTLVTQGDDESFGVSFRHTAFEIPPSLRVRLLPTKVVRIYGDVGVGMVVVTTKSTETEWYLVQDDSAGLMTRFAIGLEFGPPRGPMFLLEPLSTRTYWLNDTYGRIGFMAGFGGRF